MPQAIMSNKPVSDYRCKYCSAAPFLVMPEKELRKPARARLSVVHVTHKEDCPLGLIKQYDWGMPRII